MAAQQTGNSLENCVPASELSGLSLESRSCLELLVAHAASPVQDYGVVRQAAVLVVLFQRQGDDKLSVLLTTRAKTLRRHPSQTALPGGKVDPEDPHPIHTARREASEEVHLPLEHPAIHHLTILDPVLTILPLNAHLKNHIVVIPVVCFLSDPALVDQLHPNPDEVDAIFTHPLRGCLDGKVYGDDAVGLSEKGGPWWPFEEEHHSMEDRTGVTGGYRMHRFRTKHSPIKGLTSDVLINTASIAYGRPPAFDRFAPHQPPFSTTITNVVAELPDVLEQDRLSVLAGEVKEVRPLEWGTIDPSVRWRSGEVYETT